MIRIYGFTLVEVLIAISIIVVVIIAVLAFRIYYNNYIESLVIKNNLKGSIAKAYYSAVLQSDSFPSSSENLQTYFKDLQKCNSHSFYLDKIRITFKTLKTEEVYYKEGYKALNTIQEVEATYKYRNKEIIFKMNLPFIIHLEPNTPVNPSLPEPPGIKPPGNPNRPGPENPSNIGFIIVSKSF